MSICLPFLLYVCGFFSKDHAYTSIEDSMAIGDPRVSIFFLQSNESRYACMWMSSSESGGEPKLICIPKLQLLDVIRMR